VVGSRVSERRRHGTAGSMRPSGVSPRVLVAEADHRGGEDEDAADEQRGAEIVHRPIDQGYGLPELRVRDRDGHVLAFGERI
jgi:hypothetical protein